MAIVATVGAASANSFVTLAEANTYMAHRLNAEIWFDGDQESALVEAARELGGLEYLLQGYRVDDVQALAFPRVGVINTYAPVDTAVGTYTGYPEYADDEIPTRWKEAQIELAYEFLRAGTTDIAALDDSRGVVSETVGPISTTWEPGQRAVGLSRFPRVMNLLAPFLIAGAGQMGVVRS